MPPITSSRPTIVIEGRNSQVLTDSLLTLAVVENVEGEHRCEAVFSNWGPVAGQVDFLFFDGRLLDFGVAFRVTSGDPANILFDGRIVAIEGGFPRESPPTISVRAEDRLSDLRMTRRTRTFHDLSDADVMNRIAADHGLTPDIDVPGANHEVLAQVNQSDLTFLRDRARAIGAEIRVNGDTLHAQMRAHRDGTGVALAQGKSLQEFSVIADLTLQRTAIVVAGWDVERKEAIESVATDAVLATELGNQSSGPALLASRFGSREETVVHTVPMTSEEAQARAASCFKEMARRFVVGHGVAEDVDGLIRVGAHLDLSGLGPLFSGPYYVTETRQLFDAQIGMRTEFTAETAGLGPGT